MTTTNEPNEETQESLVRPEEALVLRNANSDHELMLLHSTSSQPDRFDPQAGKIGWAILWLLGVPLPLLVIIYLIWGR